MASACEGGELIDVVVRLPRKAVEETLLSAAFSEKDEARRRYCDAKALVSGRRRRSACFHGVRFCDPSWDMILELYVATQEGRHLAVSQLCSLSGGSITTALRHIEHLEALGYISRDLDPEDRRRANVFMLPPLKNAAERWLDLQFAASQIGACEQRHPLADEHAPNHVQPT